MRIAVLGATGHVAKCAAWSFAGDSGAVIDLYSRSPERAERAAEAVASMHPGVRAKFATRDYGEFFDNEYDLIFNGVGVWDTPGQGPERIFEITEKYDDLVLSYQKNLPGSISVHVSSGAVYGGDYTAPAGEGSPAVIPVNGPRTGDWYTAAKLNSELKHRAHRELNILDIRLFGFFSRFMDTGYRYMLSAMIRAAGEGTVFRAVPEEFWRDYVSLGDFSALLHAALERRELNRAVDVRSAAPISKSELIELFAQKYGMRYEIAGAGVSRTGNKPYYYSLRQNDLYTPSATSRETVEAELEYFLGGR